jgi:hypothetical protein
MSFRATAKEQQELPCRGTRRHLDELDCRLPEVLSHNEAGLVTRFSFWIQFFNTAIPHGPVPALIFLITVASGNATAVTSLDGPLAE